VHSSSREEAEDLTSQTFERALAAIDRYQPRGAPFSQWLYRIAANLAIDRARRKGGAVMIADAVLPVAGQPDRAPQPPELVERWELANWLLDRISNLPSEQQRAVQLRFWKERSFAEIGETMGRSEPALLTSSSWFLARNATYLTLRTLDKTV
jgi:RNA polymerase sigma-70 factor (ECF subfamily)